MILRSAVLRRGRCALASPGGRQAIRLLSTESSSKETGSESGPSLLDSDLPATRPKMTSSRQKRNNMRSFLIPQLAVDSAHEHRGKSWSHPHEIAPGETLSPEEQYAEFQRVQNNTRNLGSSLEYRQSAKNLLTDPPRPREVTLELLMASQTHMGHNTSRWNPANSRYIYGVRQGIHIISLEVTAAHLRRAARVVEEVAFRGGIILFAGTRPGQMEIVVKAAQMASACHLFSKWVPGTITNKGFLLGNRPTKMLDHLDAELPGFGQYAETANPLTPDLVVCLNPLENHTMLYECGLKGVPTIGIVDTNVDPSWVTYTIPANDDSFRSVSLVAGVLGRAGQAGVRRRLDEAKTGGVTWSTKPDVQQHMRQEIKRAVRKRNRIMGKIDSEVSGFNEEEKRLLQSRFPDVKKPMSEEEMMRMMGKSVAEETPGTQEAQEVHEAQELSSAEEVVAAQEPGHLDAASDARWDQIEGELQQMRELTLEIEKEVTNAGKEE